MKNNNSKGSASSASKGKNSNLKVAGAIAASAATLAGVYYFYGSKKAKEHRTKVSSWMKSAEKEILAEVKKLKEGALTNENYQKIVATVSNKYQTLKEADPEDIKDFVKTLNAAWNTIKTKVETKKIIKKKNKGK